MTTIEYALQHVDEVVSSQQQSLTCASLSSSLDISIDSARKILTDYVKEKEQNGVSLKSLFVISGKLKSDQSSTSVALVEKEKLGETVGKFEENYMSHIYSVSPGDGGKGMSDVANTMSGCILYITLLVECLALELSSSTSSAIPLTGCG